MGEPHVMPFQSPETRNQLHSLPLGFLQMQSLPNLLLKQPSYSANGFNHGMSNGYHFKISRKATTINNFSPQFKTQQNLSTSLMVLNLIPTKMQPLLSEVPLKYDSISDSFLPSFQKASRKTVSHCTNPLPWRQSSSRR